MVFFATKRSFERRDKQLRLIEAGMTDMRSRLKKKILSYESPQDYSASNYVATKFDEKRMRGNESILKVDGDERALQNLRYYGGKDYEEAYTRRFLEEYERSRDRLRDRSDHIQSRRTRFLDESDKRDSDLKKQRKKLAQIFGEGDGDVVRKNSSGSSDDNDDDPYWKKKKKKLRERGRSNTEAMLALIDKKRKQTYRRRVRFKPKNARTLFEENVYNHPADYIDPDTQTMNRGYDNLESENLKRFLSDHTTRHETDKSALEVRDDYESLDGAISLNKSYRRNVRDILNSKRSLDRDQFGDVINVEPPGEESVEIGKSLAWDTSYDRLETSDRSSDDEDLINYEFKNPYDDGSGGGGGAGGNATLVPGGEEEEEGDDDDERTPFSFDNPSNVLAENAMTAAAGAENEVNSVMSIDDQNLTLKMMNLGYSDEQIAAVREYKPLEITNFLKLNDQQKILRITTILGKRGMSVNLRDGTDAGDAYVRADENFEGYFSNIRDGFLPPLLSEEYKHDAELDSLTILTSKDRKTKLDIEIENTNNDDDDGDDDPEGVQSREESTSIPEEVVEESTFDNPSDVLAEENAMNEQFERDMVTFLNNNPPVLEQTPVILEKLKTLVVKPKKSAVTKVVIDTSRDDFELVRVDRESDVLKYVHKQPQVEPQPEATQQADLMEGLRIVQSNSNLSNLTTEGVWEPKKQLSVDDYAKIVGYNDGFDQMKADIDKQQVTESEQPASINDTSLMFTKEEKLPALNVIPVSLLPLNERKEVMAAIPGEGEQQGVARMNPVTDSLMELDNEYLENQTASLVQMTRVPDVNVLERRNLPNNAARLAITRGSFQERVKYILNVLLQDATSIGRIPQRALHTKSVSSIVALLELLIKVLLNRQSNYYTLYGEQGLTLVNVDAVHDQNLPYLSLVLRGENVGTLFDISRNLFNFKMKLLSPTDKIDTDEHGVERALEAFREFSRIVLNEHGVTLDLLPFRSGNRLRESTIIQVQNLSPQTRVQNFFALMEKYLMQVYVSAGNDYREMVDTSPSMVLLVKRFSTLVAFLSQVNAKMSYFLSQSPLSLIFTETLERMRNKRVVSYRRSAISSLSKSFTSSARNSPDRNNTRGWRLIFHGDVRNNGNGNVEDLPPLNTDMNYAIDSTKTLNPNVLKEILIYLFVENQIIPPLERDYGKELSNFLSVFLADPIVDVFARHMRPLYLRGWQSSNLAEQSCLVIVEFYVLSIICIIQRALMNETGELSRGPNFLMNVNDVSPMLKLQEIFSDLVLAFNPVFFLEDELENNEAKYNEMYKNFMKSFYDNTIFLRDSYEDWLGEQVNLFDGISWSISRHDLFARIISAGGFEEARDRARLEIQSDVLPSPSSPIPDREEPLKIMITENKSTGTTDPLSPSTASDPVKIEYDGQNIPEKISIQTNDKTDFAKLMNEVKETLREEFNLVLAKNITAVTVGRDSGTKSYVSSWIRNTDLDQHSTVKYGSEAPYDNDETTVDYNASSSSEEEQEEIAPSVSYFSPDELEVAEPIPVLEKDNVIIEAGDPEEFRPPLVIGKFRVPEDGQEVISLSKNDIYTFQDRLDRHQKNEEERLLKAVKKIRVVKRPFQASLVDVRIKKKKVRTKKAKTIGDTTMFVMNKRRKDKKKIQDTLRKVEKKVISRSDFTPLGQKRKHVIRKKNRNPRQKTSKKGNLVITPEMIARAERNLGVPDVLIKPPDSYSSNENED